MKPSINGQSNMRQVVIVIARADSSRLVKETRENGACAHEGEEEDVPSVLANSSSKISPFDESFQFTHLRLDSRETLDWRWRWSWQR